MSKDKVELLNTPYGQVAYETFRARRLAFADKSGIIEFLDDEGMTPYPVLLRPRRFGKSTFVQMLKCFYDLSYKDRYDEIFSTKKIYAENLASHNTYHVIYFNFSGISGKDGDTLIDSFIIAVDLGIADFMERYPDFVFNPTEAEKKTPSGFIRAFFKAYKLYPAKKFLYIMIDEYDNFIKDGASSIVAKTFITGVSSVSLDSLTSGFNISLNVTSEACFNEYAGFTEAELAELIPQLLDLEKIGVSADAIIARMKPVYDGYCFSQEAEHTVFNSSLCLYYLDEMSLAGKFLPPEDYLDPASNHDGLKLQQLFDIAEDGLADEIIKNYLDSKLFVLDKLVENINLNKKSKYNWEQLLSMLYYLGYLTIDREASDSSSLALKIPNLFMSKLFAQCIADMRLKTNTLFTGSLLDISALMAVKDDLSTFATSCTEFLSSIFTNQVLTHMSEMALNLTLYTKLESMDGIFAEMQKSLRIVADGEKYADLVITVNEDQDNECVYLIELKYAAKTDATESRIQNLIKEASEQVLKYRSALEFRNRQIKAYAMVFAGSNCVYCRKQE